MDSGLRRNDAAGGELNSAEKYAARGKYYEIANSRHVTGP